MYEPWAFLQPGWMSATDAKEVLIPADELEALRKGCVRNPAHWVARLISTSKPPLRPATLGENPSSGDRAKTAAHRNLDAVFGVGGEKRADPRSFVFEPVPFFHHDSRPEPAKRVSADTVDEVIDVTDQAAAATTPDRREAMLAAFRRSTQFEWMFWESAYRLERWPVDA